jgi:hypothetical protein
MGANFSSLARFPNRIGPSVGPAGWRVYLMLLDAIRP